MGDCCEYRGLESLPCRTLEKIIQRQEGRSERLKRDGLEGNSVGQVASTLLGLILVLKPCDCFSWRTRPLWTRVLQHEIGLGTLPSSQKTETLKDFGGQSSAVLPSVGPVASLLPSPPPSSPNPPILLSHDLHAAPVLMCPSCLLPSPPEEAAPVDWPDRNEPEQ